jgi:anti-sigma B factor antagonist
MEPAELEVNHFMEVLIQRIDTVNVVAVTGELDGQTVPAAQEQILSVVQPGCDIVIDAGELAYMSSAGLRMMLLLYRQVSGSNGRIVLVGLSDEITDTMSATGFLDFFTTYATLDEGLAALKE